MVRKPTKSAAGKETAQNSALPVPSSQAVTKTDLSLPETQTNAAPNPSQTEMAPQVLRSVGEYAVHGGLPARRGIIYLDADTLRPIKPPVVVARKLNREDFAARWQAEFGKKLAAARTVVGLSQSDLARKAGVRQPHISKLEAGELEPRLTTVFVIADTLGVLARTLFPPMSWQADSDITNV